MKRRPAIFFNTVLSLALSVALGCGNKQKKPTRAETIKAAMEKYFQPPTGKKIKITGLWIAKQDSVQRAIEQKFLGGYKPAPDAMSTAEIRERMKTMAMFFRIQESGQLEMLTIVGDSFGPSTGLLRQRRGPTAQGEIYDAKLSGKGKPAAATFTYRSGPGGEILEYDEGGVVISAVREKRTAAELIQLFSELLNSGSGLPKY